MIELKKSEKNIVFDNTIFTSIAVGSAYELLRNDLLEHLRIIQDELHFEYCRFHGLFHDDMAVVRRDADGKLAFQWHHIDKITDSLLSLGLKPFFELNSMPEVLVGNDEIIYQFTAGWKMITNEPGDYNEWGELVEKFVSHLVDRYGLDEVKTWYFEVWNEPNLKSFWPAGMSAYLEKLYPYAAFAVKRVSRELKVGGPATAGGECIKEFIEHCAENNIPVDFISTHAYPIGEYCEYEERVGSPYKLGEYFCDRFKEVETVVKNSSMPNLEIHWTEWNTQSGNTSKNITWTMNPTVDTHFGGACVAKNMLAVMHSCDSVAYWVASDIFSEAGQAHSVFSCTYGLLNIHGIKKATFNAYKLLRKLRGSIMDCVNDKDYNLGCGICATEENGTVRIVAYNQQLPEIENQEDWNERIIVPLNNDDDYCITTAKIERGHGSCYETWVDMGAPQNISKTQEEALRYASMMNYEVYTKHAENHVVNVDFNLKANEVIYIEIQKKDVRALPRTISDESMKLLNENLMLARR